MLLLLICFGFALLISAMNDPAVGQGIVDAINLLPGLVPVAIIGALIWFVIAWFANQAIIDGVTGARRVDRTAEPRVWNLLENLCISRGITTPALRIIETDARNAFASGIREGRYSVTVTRGLVDALDDAELEAVLAHELTHIRNRDVQLLVIAAVFVGIVSLAGDLIIRSPRVLFSGGGGGGSGGGWNWGGGRSRSRSSGKSGGGAIVLVLIAIAIFVISRFLAVALRFAMSRKREYLADAGSVDLTKNPDAMISALRKIAGHSELQAPAQIQEMFLDLPAVGIFASHPSIEKRIAALVEYAGGRDLPVSPEIAREPNPALEPAPIDGAGHAAVRRRETPSGTSSDDPPTARGDDHNQGHVRRRSRVLRGNHEVSALGGPPRTLGVNRSDRRLSLRSARLAQDLGFLDSLSRFCRRISVVRGCDGSEKSRASVCSDDQGSRAGGIRGLLLECPVRAEGNAEADPRHARRCPRQGIEQRGHAQATHRSRLRHSRRIAARPGSAGGIDKERDRTLDAGHQGSRR